MTLENQSFDIKLVALNAQLIDLQEEILRVNKAKEDYYSQNRKKFLLNNSISLKGVKLEKHDGIYFIVANDDKFEYVVRMTSDQAAELADDLDHEIALDLEEEINKPMQKLSAQASIVNNMFSPIFKNIKNEKLG